MSQQRERRAWARAVALGLAAGALISAQACSSAGGGRSDEGASADATREGAPAKAASLTLGAPPTTDLLWRHETTGQNVAWRMLGTQFIDGGGLPAVTDLGWRLQATADLNADGHADFVWRHQPSGQNVVWLMNGEALASAVALPTVDDLGWNIAGAGDMNGDGKPDLVWRHGVSGQNVVWQLDGTTLVVGVTLTPVDDLNWSLRGLGDLDGDGHLDLVWRHLTSGENVVWFMDRLSLRVASALPPVADLTWQIEAVDDFNGDRKADLVWRNQASGQNTFWLMNGAALQGQAPLLAVDDLGWHVAGTRRGPAVSARGVASWRLEYEASNQTVSAVRGFGADAAGVEVVRADLRVRLSDAAGLGSTDDDQVAAAMMKAIEVLDVSPLGEGAPLAEDEKRTLFASFARALDAYEAAPDAAAPTDAAALAASGAPVCKPPASDPECSAGGCSNGFAKKGNLRRPWLSAGAIGIAAAKLAHCGLQACGGGASLGSFLGPGGAALACAGSVAAACGLLFVPLAAAINQNLCDNGVGTYAVTLDGVMPDVRCSCKAELEDADAAMQPSNFNELPEQRCVACPKGTQWNDAKQSCLCGDNGKLPNGVDCQSAPGDRQAACCPDGTEWDGQRCKGPCPSGQHLENGTCVAATHAIEWVVARAVAGCNTSVAKPVATNPCSGRVYFTEDGSNDKGRCIIPYNASGWASVSGPPACKKPTIVPSATVPCRFESRSSDDQTMANLHVVLPCLADQGSSEEFDYPIVLDSWSTDVDGQCLCDQ